jgi:hypothetical protein
MILFIDTVVLNDSSFLSDQNTPVKFFIFHFSFFFFVKIKHKFTSFYFELFEHLSGHKGNLWYEVVLLQYNKTTYTLLHMIYF